MVAHTKALLPPHLDIHAQLSGYTVSERVSLPDGDDAIDELLAADSAGACVILRVALDPQSAHRMRTEASLAQLHLHDGIVQSIGLFEVGGWPVQVLEHIDGISLDKLALIAGGLPAEAVTAVGHQVALALCELHGREPVTIHGALAAERVVIDVHGNVRLRDLGRLRPEQDPRSVSPERRGTQGAGPPSVDDDLYALGILLVETALGHPLEVGDVRLLDGVLPARLVDALTVLLGPVGARLTNAAAAVRMFSELERACGDGQRALRVAIERVQLGDVLMEAGVDEEAPITVPDGAPVDAAAPAGPALSSQGGIELPAAASAADALAPVQVARKQRAVPSNTRVLAVASAVLLGISTVVTAPVWLPPVKRPAFDDVEAAPQHPATTHEIARVPAFAPVEPAIVPVVGEAPGSAASQAKAAIAAHAAQLVQKPTKPVKTKARLAEAKASAALEASMEAKAAPTQATVKLAIDGVSEAMRASAEASLRACGLSEATVGVLQISGKVLRVTTDPKNGCVERALKQAMRGLKDSQPFELTPQ